MHRYAAFLLIFSLFFRFDPAYSIFGAADVALEEYYKLGRHQTGVASVQTKKFHRSELKTSFGTANLIDVKDIGIPILKGLLGALEGRVLITAAHVIDDKFPEDCSIRFMDTNNESQNMEVEAFYTPDDFRDTDDDIGIIILKTSVDISRFKPLKLNLSIENESFSGKLVNIFGCTPVFGKVNSDIVIRESADTLVRRGMTTVVDNCRNDRSELSSNFYSSLMRVSIVRDSIQTLTESDREKKHKIEEELERFDALINTTQSATDKIDLTLKRSELSRERFSLNPIEIRKRLFWTFIYNENNIQEQLDTLEDTEDLDKLTLISEWEKFICEGRYGNKSLDLGIYQVKFYGPLPRLKGQVYHGDSGGAWVINDEIMGISKIMVGAKHRKSNFVEVKTPLTPSTDVSEYFIQCEAIISQSSSPNDENFLTYSATSIWSYRNWIESTLLKINAELTQSLPCSSSLLMPGSSSSS
jgi:hypothetical protein